MTHQAQQGKKKVLVADDEPAILRSVNRVLGNTYVVIEANNGEEAVDLAKRHRPHIILLDMMMPKKDGLTSCAELRADKTTKAIPIIMLTGVGHELNKDLARSLGAIGYIVKPFKAQELLDTIAKFL